MSVSVDKMKRFKKIKYNRDSHTDLTLANRA